MPSVAEKFRDDFALWEWRLVFIENRPKSDIEEIRHVIRMAWENEKLRELWIDFVAVQAEESQKLRDLSRGITDRIKAKIEQEKAK